MRRSNERTSFQSEGTFEAALTDGSEDVSKEEKKSPFEDSSSSVSLVSARKACLPHHSYTAAQLKKDGVAKEKEAEAFSRKGTLLIIRHGRRRSKSRHRRRRKKTTKKGENFIFHFI